MPFQQAGPEAAAPTSDHQAVGTVQFKVSQRRGLLVWSAVCFALLVGAVTDLATGTDILRGDVRTMLILVGAVFGPLLLDLASGTTTLTATALTTKSLLGRGSCAWSEIQRVATKESLGRGYSAWIYVHPATQRPIKLKAPFSTKRSTDTQLDEVISTIRRYQAKAPCLGTGRH